MHDFKTCCSSERKTIINQIGAVVPLIMSYRILATAIRDREAAGKDGMRNGILFRITTVHGAQS